MPASQTHPAHARITRESDRGTATIALCSETIMHYDAHKNIIEALEARILTIRDSL
jgi:hypothetical protein